MTRLALAVLAICLLLLCPTGCSRETRFPQQPISLICPWSAGGGTDRVARQVAAQLEPELGVPVNVINATGGGGVTGHTRGAIARPDGHTLTMITVELSMLHWRGLTNVTHEDFAPLKLLNRDAAALFVRGDSDFQSLDQLQAAIASGSRLKASGTAYGGIWHIAVAGWLDARGLPTDAVNWVSINGAGPSIQELLAGGVDFICCSLPEADAVLSGGQVRCLGVMADERDAAFEDVPTFIEQGHAWAIAGWRGLAAPRETPPERLEILSAAVNRVTESGAFAEFMDSAGFNVSLEDPEEFGQTLAHQDRLFGDILSRDAFRQVSGEHFGPMMFPAMIAIALLLTLPVVVLDIRREAVASAASLETPSQQSSPSQQGEPSMQSSPGDSLAGQQQRDELRWRSYRHPVAVLLAVLFYYFASEPLGFVATAALMLSGLLLAFRTRPVLAVSVAVLAAVIAYQAFGVLLRVPLPHGFLEW